MDVSLLEIMKTAGQSLVNPCYQRMEDSFPDMTPSSWKKAFSFCSSQTEQLR